MQGEACLAGAQNIRYAAQACWDLKGNLKARKGKYRRHGAVKKQATAPRDSC